MAQFTPSSLLNGLLPYRPVLIGSCLVAILTCLICLRLIASEFAYETPFLGRPVASATAIMITAGLAFFLLILWTYRAKLSRIFFLWGVLLGLFSRIIWFGSSPIYEDDFYRYFLDGATVHHGLNPYMVAPADFQTKPILPNVENLFAPIDDLKSTQPDTYAAIREEGQIDRVAYPYVWTIYPPVAQAFFALSYQLAPWSLDGWRFILLLVDGISLMLLLALLKHHGKKPWLAMIFWLNPLVITETMNAGHMDAVLLPFLIGSALLASKKYHARAGLALAAAVGVKLWPLLLAPLLFAPLIKTPRLLAARALPFVIASLVLLMPQALAKFDSSSGIGAYTEFWQVNAFLFSMLEQASGLISDDSGIWSRLMITGLIGAFALTLSWKNITTQQDYSLHALMITVALFLLSPTGYPWYFLWLIPGLVLYLSPALLLLVVTLPLYDLRYMLDFNDSSHIFNQFVVPLEFAPTLLWLALDWFRQHRKAEIPI